MLTWALMYPIDVIKTIIQSDISDNTLKQRDVLNKLIKEKGISSLYKGISICLIRAFFVSAVFFNVNEFFKIYLKELSLNLIYDK
jgi:hypothetical protein